MKAPAVRGRWPITAIILALLLSGGSAFAARPQTLCQLKAEEILGTVPLSTGVSGVLAVRLCGDTLVCVNPSSRFVPASNIKLITTGIALKVLGEDFRFKTSVACCGTIREGILDGDIYIVGGGDPTTGADFDLADSPSELFAKWKSFLDAAGISGVKGRIVGDPRFWDDDEPDCISWTIEDNGYYYAVSPAALNYCENAQKLTLVPGAEIGSLLQLRSCEPAAPWMSYDNLTRTVAPRRSSVMRYSCSAFGPQARIWGSLATDRKAFSQDVANRYGALTCAHEFYKYLTESGMSVGGYADIDVSGCLRAGPSLVCGPQAASPEELTELGSTVSVRLAAIASRTNHKSDNFFAEALLKTLGRRSDSSTGHEQGIRAVTEELKRMGVPPAYALQLRDGCGLSRENYASPSFFVSFLSAMARTDVFRSYLGGLPQPGEPQTTLSLRLKDAPQDLKDRIHMKSGGMNGVRCFSGYIDSPDGDPSRMTVFSILTNNVPGHSGKVYPLIDNIIASIAEETQ